MWKQLFALGALWRLGPFQSDHLHTSTRKYLSGCMLMHLALEAEAVPGHPKLLLAGAAAL